MIALPTVETVFVKLMKPLLAVLQIVTLLNLPVETQFVNLVNLSTLAQVIALPVLFVVMEFAKMEKADPVAQLIVDLLPLVEMEFVMAVKPT